MSYRRLAWDDFLQLLFACGVVRGGYSLIQHGLNHDKDLEANRSEFDAVTRSIDVLLHNPKQSPPAQITLGETQTCLTRA